MKKSIILISIFILFTLSACNYIDFPSSTTEVLSQIPDNIEETTDIENPEKILPSFDEFLSRSRVYSDNGLVWIVEPTYDEVKYYLGGFLVLDEFILDAWNRDIYSYDPEWIEFSIGDSDPGEFLYDEEKQLYGRWFRTYALILTDMYPASDFNDKIPILPYRDKLNKLNAFRKVDSDKIIGKTGEISIDIFEILNDAYIGDKYAFAYNSTFVTDFIYDYSVNWWIHNDRDDAVAVGLDGKWGVIGKDGEIMAPFVFDELIFIDDVAAFAKYNGKFGILDVRETAKEN